jgi:hypothetical protein
MSDADVIIAWVSNNQVIISDRYSSEKAAPKHDAKQDVTLIPALSKVTGTTWTATFTRPLKASEPAADKDLVEGPASYIWAFGAAPDSSDPAFASLQIHEGRGIDTGDAFSAVPGVSGPDVSSALVTAHMILMWLAWNVFTPFAIFIARYCKSIGVWWFRYVAFCGLTKMFDFSF